MRIARRLLGRLRQEDGVTLVELLVVMSVMGVVMAAFLGIFVVVQKSFVRETNRSQTMDQARLAIEAIDREMRTGSILCVTTVSSNPTLTTYGISSFSTTDYTTKTWIQYQVADSSDALQRREYSGGSWGSWRTVASGILNTTSTAPFTLNSSSQYSSTSGASRLVSLSLIVNAVTSDTTQSNTTLSSAVAIRNQDTTLSCASIPAG